MELPNFKTGIQPAPSPERTRLLEEMSNKIWHMRAAEGLVVWKIARIGLLLGLPPVETLAELEQSIIEHIELPLKPRRRLKDADREKQPRWHDVAIARAGGLRSAAEVMEVAPRTLKKWLAGDLSKNLERIPGAKVKALAKAARTTPRALVEWY